MSATLPYIGSQISLISKSDIRYEGTLSSIDTSQHTVSLSNVRSFGTEGRRGDGREIPASNDIYEIIIFRGADIKDLTVIQSTSTTSSIPEAKPEPVERRRPQRRAARSFNSHSHGELHQATDAALKESLKEDFDFGSATLSRSETKEDGSKRYDKNKGFFDNLTVGDREEFDRHKQKATDKETFGEESVYFAERELKKYNNRRGRGFRRGRGRRPRA
jgi:hypothetical protein